MPEAPIQLPPDGNGKLTRGQSNAGVASGAIQPVNTTAGPDGTLVGARADGFMNVREDPTTWMFDTFETVDTVNTWTLGGSVPPTQGTAGVVSASPGTAAGATSFSRSQPAFAPGSNAFLVYASLVQIEAAVLTGSTRWWGLAVPNPTPTTTTPITNGSIFEVEAATGAMFGRVYSGGALTASVALTRPTDGALHRYQIQYRASRVYWNIDGVEVGSVPFPSPAVGTLPASMGAVNGGVAVGTAPVLNLSLVGVADSARRNFQLSDGTFPWRKQTVRANGAADVNLASSAGNVPVVTGTLPLAFSAATSLVQADVSASGNATISLQGGTFTGLPIIFEASADGGTNWFAVDATQADGTGVNTALTLPANGGPRNWNIPCPGYTHLRVRQTAAAATYTAVVTIRINQGPFLSEPSPTIAPLDGQKATFSGVLNPAAAAGLASANDVAVIMNPTGSGRTIRITRLDLQVTIATAIAGIVALAKRSTLSTGGTLTPATRVPHDTSNPATVVAAANIGVYTVAPTAVGTLVGQVRQRRRWLPATALSATVNTEIIELLNGNRPAQAIVLRPGEMLGIQVLSITGGAAGTAPTVTGDIEWTEE